MDQISRPYSHDIFHKASYRRPSFLSSVLPPTINSGHDSPAHLGSSEKVHPSQYGILASRALLTPPSSDVGTTRRCGCANDSDPASRNHTNGDRHSPLSSRASPEHFEWPSTPTRRPSLSPNPRCHGLDGTSKLNPSIESYNFPPTGNTGDRSAMISASEHSSLNEMTFVPPPPYRRTPPPVEDFAEALAEHAHHRPATILRKSSEVMHYADSEYPTNALGLDLATHLPTPSPSPPSSLTDLPTETSTTSLSVPKRRRLRITIPESPTTCGTPSPPRPVTALYYPQSGAGDICPSPPVEDSLYRDSVFPEVHDHASVTSYDERGSALSSKSVRFAEETVQYSPQYSPQSPPRLARWKCIPLPPDYSLEESLHSPVDVSFAMLSLHDDDYASHLGFTHDSARCIKEQLLPVTNLPQDTGVDLLSPLPLTPAPSYCLEDLQQQISQCLDSTDRIYSTIASSPAIPEIDVATVFADLTSALQGVRKESLRPAPDLELLAKAHGAEWRRKYERVVMSLDRNLDRCVRVAEEAGARSQHSRHLLSLKDALVWHARKFEDLRRRLEVFHDHVSLLEKRAEYQELTMAIRAEMNAERAYRQTFKVATERIKARRHALKEHIRCEEEAARTRWSRTTRSH